MNLIEISLRRPVFAWILMAALIIFGAVSLNKLGVSQMPDVNFPVLTITINYPGAAPEVIENEIIDITEQRLLSVEGIKEMRSQATQGVARITLEFDINRNIDVALQEVQTALSQLRLPTGLDPAIIRKSNPEEDPILIVAVYGEAEIKEIIRFVQNSLMDQLQFISGVGEVTTGGFPARNMRVWIDVKKLKAFDLAITDVIDAVRSQHLESAAGQYVDNKQEVRVRYLGEAKSIGEMENFPIQKRGGQLIQDKIFHIRDVATVEDGFEDVQRVARVGDKPAVTLQIKKQRGTNEVDVAQAVLKKLAEIKYPTGMQYRVNVDNTKSTKATVDLTIEKLWAASLITILVCFFFLGSFRSSINILFSIPTSILGTFIILYFSGFTLNLFTLLALTLSISIVVDDAIMILENIVRHSRMGKSPYDAALDGSKEVLPAAIAASLAVLAVFLPVIFMDGVIGKFLFHFGITMSAAVLLSLLEAVTITPMRAAALLRKDSKMTKMEQKLDHIFEKLEKGYQGLLDRCLNHKWIVLTVSMIFFALTLTLIKKIKQEFVPQQDQNIIILNAQAQTGTSLAATSEMVKPIEELLNTMPEIQGFLTAVGPGQLFMPITLVDQSKRSITHVELMNKIREQAKGIKGLRISMRDISSRNLTTGRLNPMAFNLQGPDLEVLNTQSQKIMKELAEQKLAVDIDSDYRVGLSELALSPNRDELLRKGVSVDAVSQVLQAAIAGVRAGQFLVDGKRNDIRFKVKEDQITNGDDVKKLYVRNNYGNLIQLIDLVKDKDNKALQQINRINRQRAISVYGNLYAGQSQSVVLKKAKEIAEKNLPAGYTFNLEGASAGFSSSFSNMFSALMIGILVAYMILATQFNSFRDPISVLMALPFSFSGALLILWMFDVSLNLFSFIGLIVLMGIAKKNSIMLVEFTTQVLHKDKTSWHEALLKACPVRLRPIMMTSVATVFAALPLVLGGGLGHETRQPMGLVIVGGTIVSTIFTLFVVPVFYLILNEIRLKKNQQRLGKFAAPISYDSTT
ncbi:MAG: efflux RND transporter permease subunit [Bdellovibrio sp.]|nr:efflux RND transporter permease subunit [Bdellovibrio sp.]